MSKRTITLIGGAPLSGKSTLAADFAKERGISWVSTDDIRKWMKALVRKEDYPGLFYGDDQDAETFYERQQTLEAIYDHQAKQAVDVQKGILAFIENFWWWHDFIIEGIDITPQFAKHVELQHKGKRDMLVSSLFLVDRDDGAHLKQRLTSRGLWGKPYPERVKPLELNWVLLFNEYLKVEAEKWRFHAMSVGGPKFNELPKK